MELVLMIGATWAGMIALGVLVLAMTKEVRSDGE
jgi:hypothetical protein